LISITEQNRSGGGGALEKPIEVKKVQHIYIPPPRQVGTFTIYVSVGTDDE
jgi:hypothetical protein